MGRFGEGCKNMVSRAGKVHRQLLLRRTLVRDCTEEGR